MWINFKYERILIKNKILFIFIKNALKCLFFLILTTIYVIITLDFIKKEDSHEKNSNKR